MPIIWLCLGAVGKMIGDPKHRGTLGFALGFFLGPIGLLIIKLLPAKQLPAMYDPQAWVTGRHPRRPLPTTRPASRVGRTLGIVFAGIVLVGMIVGMVAVAPRAASDEHVVATPPAATPGMTPPRIGSVASKPSPASLAVDDIDARDRRAGRVWVKGYLDKNGKYVEGHYSK